MHPTRRRPRGLRFVAAVAFAGSLTLTACGGDGDPGSESATSTPTPTPTVQLPAGVELTDPGAQLAFGQTATAEYAPDPSSAGALSLTVKDAALGRLADLKGFDLSDAYRKNANYYYVNVTVENVGDADLGGHDVPLNGVNAEDTLLPPVVFESAFSKCPSERLPKVFHRGDRLQTCLVFLSPDKGALTAVSFKPSDAAEPITWTGTVQSPAAEPRRQGEQG